MRIVQKWWGTNKEELEVLFTDPPWCLSPIRPCMAAYLGHTAADKSSSQHHPGAVCFDGGQPLCEELMIITLLLNLNFIYRQMICLTFSSLHFIITLIITLKHEPQDSLTAMSCYCHYSSLAHCLFSVWIEQWRRELQNCFNMHEHEKSTSCISTLHHLFRHSPWRQRPTPQIVCSVDQSKLH